MTTLYLEKEVKKIYNICQVGWPYNQRLELDHGILVTFTRPPHCLSGSTFPERLWLDKCGLRDITNPNTQIGG